MVVGKLATAQVRSFKWYYFAVTTGIVGYLAYDPLRRQLLCPKRQFQERITVVPYGVLGDALTTRKEEPMARRALHPSSSTTIVDPAGLKYIMSTCDKAGGAAGAIYRWLGLKGAFPSDVREKITQPTHAAFHQYGDKKVVHVVGPDFREGNWSEKEAQVALAITYQNMLREFLAAGSSAPTLRALPVSGGVFAGKFSERLPALTEDAFLKGFEQLKKEEQNKILKQGTKVEFCIFMDKEWDAYKDILKKPCRCNLFCR